MSQIEGHIKRDSLGVFPVLNLRLTSNSYFPFWFHDWFLPEWFILILAFWNDLDVFLSTIFIHNLTDIEVRRPFEFL